MRPLTFNGYYFGFMLVCISLHTPFQNQNNSEVYNVSNIFFTLYKEEHVK